MFWLNSYDTKLFRIYSSLWNGPIFSVLLIFIQTIIKDLVCIHAVIWARWKIAYLLTWGTLGKKFLRQFSRYLYMVCEPSVVCLELFCALNWNAASELTVNSQTSRPNVTSAGGLLQVKSWFCGRDLHGTLIQRTLVVKSAKCMTLENIH